MQACLRESSTNLNEALAQDLDEIARTGTKCFKQVMLAIYSVSNPRGMHLRINNVIIMTVTELRFYKSVTCFLGRFRPRRGLGICEVIFLI